MAQDERPSTLTNDMYPASILNPDAPSPDTPSHSPSSTSHLNPLALLSRNTSVMSSSSSSSSSSSLVLAPPSRPPRSFSSDVPYLNGRRDGTRTPPALDNYPSQAGTRTPNSPRSPRGFPRQLRIPSQQSSAPDIDEHEPPRTPTQATHAAHLSGHHSGPPPVVARTPNRSRSSSAARRVYSADDFEMGELLGEGAYSTVISATHRRTHHVYALKIMHKHHLQRVNKVKYAYVEKDSLAKLSTASHPGVVKLHWAFSDASSLYYVLDLVDNGDLMAKINHYGSLSLECARYYTAQMVDAIAWMHGLGIIHRDMKPENVLIGTDLRIKITDFGTARIMDKTDNDRTSSFVGSPGYISPELLLHTRTCKSSDFWAIGCILFQMICGSQPFKAITPYLSLEKTKSLDYAFPDGFDHIAADLVRDLLVLDPAGRLGDAARGGPDALRAHDFFRSITWMTLWTGPAPPLEVGLVKRDPKRKRTRVDSNGNEVEVDDNQPFLDVGAAWEALVYDQSEEEMNGTHEDEEEGTVGDPHENEGGDADEPAPPVTRSDRLPFPPVNGLSKELPVLPLLPPPVIIPSSTPSGLGEHSLSIIPSSPLTPPKSHLTGSSKRTSSWGSSVSSSEENAITSTHRGISLSPQSANIPRRGRRGMSNDKILARDMQLHPLPRAPSLGPPVSSAELSTSAPASLPPIRTFANGILNNGEYNGYNSGSVRSSVPVVMEEQLGLGGTFMLGSPPSSSGMSSGSSDASLKWMSLLRPNERVIFSSPVRVRRRSILPARTKPRILVLTDAPRLLCLKEHTHSISSGRGGGGADGGEGVKIKSEVNFDSPGSQANGTPVPPAVTASLLPTSSASPTTVATPTTAANETPMIAASVSLSDMSTLRGRTGFPSRSRTRTRTLSSNAGIMGAGTNSEGGRKDIVKNVDGKGDKFVVQTDGKVFTYVADNAALATRWVHEIQTVRGASGRPRQNSMVGA